MQDSKKDTDVYSGLLDSEGEGEGHHCHLSKFHIYVLVYSIGVLKHVYYHVRIESPVYVRCRIQHAWGWCTGMTQREVEGMEVGGGVHVWDRTYTHGGFMSMYGKTNTVL